MWLSFPRQPHSGALQPLTLPTHPALALQMVPAQGDGKRAQHPGGGGGGAWWNPLARLGAKLSEGRQLSKRVQQRAADLGAAASKASGSGSSKQGSSSQGAGGSDAADASASGAPSSSDALAIVPAGPGSAPAVGQVQQYVLQEAPVRRILAGGAPPQLAWVPLRVALQLLRSLPQHFVLLQGAPFLPGGGRRKDSQRQQHQQQQPASTSQQGQAGSAFTAASAPADLSVHVIPVRRSAALLGPGPLRAWRQQGGVCPSALGAEQIATPDRWSHVASTAAPCRACC